MEINPYDDGQAAGRIVRGIAQKSTMGAEMPKVRLELSEELVEAMKLPPEEVSLRLKRELAVRLYEKRLLGFGKARELAGGVELDAFVNFPEQVAGSEEEKGREACDHRERSG